MSKRIGLVLAVVVAFFLWPTDSASANPFEYAWQELAPGVWAAIRQDPFELPQEGNSVFVATTDGVVVFDAGGSPLMGEAIVAKVRAVTSVPISHVIVSHWHGDHIRGLQSIQAAFPGVKIFAHPFSRDFIAATQERWLKRRVNMVPGIRNAISAAFAKNEDLSGRPLIAPERAWLEQGLTILDQLDAENKRTSFVVPNSTIADQMTLRMGGREIQFMRLGNAHTAGDLVMWLPQEKIVATGDIVTGPIPLMPSPYTGDYARVLTSIKALGFKTLVPGHGLPQHDAQYVDLLSDTVATISAQMKALVAQRLSQADAIAKIDYSSIEPRFTHGDPFLKNRFQDYVVNSALAVDAYLGETGAAIEEKF